MKNMKFLKLIKNKKASLVSVCLVFPLWLLLIFIMLTETTNHQRLLELNETNQVISRIVQTSENFSKCNKLITEYVNNSKLGNGAYQYNNTKGGGSFIYDLKAYYENGTEVDSNDLFTKDWEEKWIISYSITIYTPSYMSNVNKISVGSQSYSIIDDMFTISSTVIHL